MFKSIPNLLYSTIDKFPQKDALCYLKDGTVKTYSYQEFGEIIKHLGCALIQSGLKRKDKIAILSNNRPEWTITDFASLATGLIVIPLYQTLPSNQIEYILKDSDTRAIFVENEEQYKKIETIRGKLPNLEFVFSFDKVKNFVESFPELVTKGKSYSKENPSLFQDEMEKIDPKDICTYVYTSGTTGNPKGVMLFHKGFIDEIISSESRLNLDENEVFLSFLPLSHLYERVAGHWTPMYRSNTIFYAQSIETVVDDIAIAKPTVIVSVPRLFEKIAAKVIDQVEHSSNLKRKIFYWALKTGRKYRELKIEGNVPFGMQQKYNLANKLVFTKIKEKLGGRLKYPIAGGAPLSVDTLKFFEALNMQIIEGYGMTETHLIIALTPAGKTRYGSCGTPIDGVEVKIARDGEVLVKSDMLMVGYYKQKNLTRDAIDKDGWLHTGDVGYLDKDKFLYLTDRKKNFLITSGGKNVASAPLENKLKSSKYIEEVCLVGDHRKFISALVVPDFDALKQWATLHKYDVDSNQKLVKHPEIRKFLWQEVENLQQNFARFEKIKKIGLLSESFSLEKNELTPSLKIRRKKIMENYSDIIEELYQIDSVV